MFSEIKYPFFALKYSGVLWNGQSPLEYLASVSVHAKVRSHCFIMEEVSNEL